MKPAVKVVFLLFLSSPLLVKGQQQGSREFWAHVKDRFRQIEQSFSRIEQKVDDIQGGITGIVDEGIHDPFGIIDQPARPQTRANIYPERERGVDRFDVDRFDVDRFDVPDFKIPKFNFPNFNSFFRVRNEWWHGPHVCVTREEIDEDSQTNEFPFHMQSTNCMDTGTSHKCVTRVRSHGVHKTFIVNYHCCHGYQRDQVHGTCEKVDLRPMLETIKNSGGEIFAELINFSGLNEKFENHNLTVFCPTDDVLKIYHEDFENNVVVMTPTVHRRRRADSNDHLVLSHALSGFLQTGDFSDEKILLTENPSAQIRTNVYNLPQRVMTVNCARIVSANNFATTGIVHMINGVLQPVTETLSQLLAIDPRFSIFKSLLEKNNLLDQLSQDGHLTIMAPTDEAFHQLDPDFLSKLLAGKQCAISILKYHILPNVVCQQALPLRARSTTNLGTDVKFRREDDRLLVNDVPVVTDDEVMATNGVLYPIEGLLQPSESKPLTKVLDEWQLHDVVQMMQDANLIDKLDNLSNYTFFAPTNRAIKQSQHILDDMKQNSPEKLAEVLMYHVGFPQMLMCGVDNNQVIKSGIHDKSIRFNHFTTMFGLSHQITAQCAPIMQLDGKSCEGSIQVVDKVLFPPEGHLADIIASNQSFSLFRKLLQAADFENEITNHGPYTILAPSDQAFHNLPEEQLTHILNDKHAADAVIRNHILPEVLCCAGVPFMDYMFHESIRSLGGSLHVLHRRHNGIYIGGAHVSVCDVMADNGVVHLLNSVLMPPNNHREERRPMSHWKWP